MDFWLLQTEGDFNQVLIQAEDVHSAMDRVEEISDTLKNASHPDTPAPVVIKDSPLNWFAPIFTDEFFQQTSDKQVEQANKMAKLLVEG